MKCQSFIAKWYRLSSFHKRSVFLSVLKFKMTVPECCFYQDGLSTGNCSAGSDIEGFRRKEQPEQSHRTHSSHRLTLFCRPTQQWSSNVSPAAAQPITYQHSHMSQKDNSYIIIPSPGCLSHRGALDHLLPRDSSTGIPPLWNPEFDLTILLAP